MENSMKGTRLTRPLLASVLAWSALLLLRPPAASAVPARLTDDAYTQVGSTSNFGTAGVLRVAPGTSAQKSFIKIDLTSLKSSLPSGLTSANVQKATLTLFASGVATAGTINVVRVTSTWA